MAAGLPVGRVTGPLWLLLAYAVPAVTAWMLAGAAINAVPATASAALMLTALYAGYYGLIETAGRPGLPPPGRSWQVPSPWVDGVPRWRRLAVWGCLLGPGFATRNLYAGFGLLLLAVGCARSIPLGASLAALVGLLHAAGRAAGLLRDIRRPPGQDYLAAVATSLQWRTADGVALLAVTGIAAAMVLAHG